ncbi:hypothetical protein [Nonomuraea sp. CA-141351]|uniref:hypothetical protein n=1 Tax=Nonomuraea sp. CA-141351 TaxID=3239996 RepID=UPI003D914307
MHRWEPHIPHGPRLRVVAVSCCDKYQLCSEAGQYFILRRAGDGYEETGRGVYAKAVQLWNTLTIRHQHAERDAS